MSTFNDFTSASRNSIGFYHPKSLIKHKSVDAKWHGPRGEGWDREKNCRTDEIRVCRSMTSGDVIYNSRQSVHELPLPKKAHATEYDPKRGWLTPLQKMSYPMPPAATPHERIIIDNWKADQKKIREGPLFVRRVVDINSRVNKATLGGTAGHNAFTSISTYSSRYERKYRLRPNHTGKLWCMFASSF